MTGAKLTTSLITDKGNAVRGLIEFQTLVELAENPDTIDNDYLQIFDLIEVNKTVDNDKLKRFIIDDISNFWPNSACLKCPIDTIQEKYLNTLTPHGAKITTEVIQALKNQEKKGFYSALFADIDQGNLNIEEVKARTLQAIKRINTKYSGACFLIYATKSSQTHDNKWRVVIPLQGVINTKHFQICQAILCKYLGGDEAAIKPFQGFMSPLVYDNDYMPRTNYRFLFHEFNLKLLHAVDIQESQSILKLMERKAEKSRQAEPTNQNLSKAINKKLFNSTDSLPKLFNEQANFMLILQRNGYRIGKDRGNKIEMILPNKEQSKGNAFLYKNTNTYHSFNSNDVLYNGAKSIKQYEAFKRLECGNDNKEAYRKIANSKDYLNMNNKTYNEYVRESKHVNPLSQREGARS